MATFTRRGDYQWQVKIRKKGYSPQSKTFNSRREAEAWAHVIESEMARGIFVSRQEAENTTLSEAMERYGREISSQKKGGPIELVRIRRWQNSKFGPRNLASLSGKDMAAWRDDRLREGAANNTVRLELAVVSHLFTIASKEWGMAGLSNPVLSIRLPAPGKGRDRRLRPGEMDRILSATDSPDLPSIVRLAVETGMRRGEIVAMTWDQVDLKNRTVILPDTKNGDRRTVPLSMESARILADLPRRLDGKVWGLKDPHSVSSAFFKALSRARSVYEKECEEKGVKPDPAFLVDLTFHDLRHEATSRFFEKGLNPMQVAAITGHKTLQMLKRYTHLKAEDLAELLK